MISRKMTVSDKFYPWDKTELKNMIDTFLKNTELKIDIPPPKAFVCPHAWYIYSWQVASYSYKLLQYNLENIPETIILLCPSHYVNFFWVSIWLYDKLDTPFWLLDVDTKLWEELLTNYQGIFKLNYEAQDKEHSLEVQLPFLKYIIWKKNIKILPLIFWDINPIEIWIILNNLLKERDVFFIVSSDLSHYKNYDKALELDTKTIDSFLSKNLNTIINNADACGLYPWICLEKIAILNNWKIKLLKYLNSWDTSWNKNEVVGYSSLVYY